jgi:hypothetical protein
MDAEDLELGDVEAKVFLSYSRKDRERAQSIADVLRERHFGVFKDTDDILPTEEWRDRLEQLVAEADTVIFLLSPHSAKSDVCAWEVDHATALNKRIAPIVIEETDAKDIPPELARLNFIFCTERDRFEDAVDSIVSALNVDIDWIREHTRLAGLAARWEKADRPGRLLLRGQDIADAEQWRDTHPKNAPEVTPLQAGFIGESRNGAARRQRNWVAGSLGVAAATIALAVFAWFQSIEADNQRSVAEQNAVEADRQRGVAEQNAEEADRQRQIAEDRRRDALKNLAANRLRAGDRAGGLLALVDADPDHVAVPILRAGLLDGSTVLNTVEVGDPFILNGALYQRGEVAAPSVPLTGFPARWQAPVGDSIALISDSGAVRLHARSGEIRSFHTPGSAQKPCAINSVDDTEINLFSVFSAGYSACSLRVARTSMDAAMMGETSVIGVCEEGTFDIANWQEPSVPANRIGDMCAARLLDEEPVDFTGFSPALQPLVPVPELIFPKDRTEDEIWFLMQPFGTAAMTDSLIRSLNAVEGIAEDDLELFGLYQFEGDDAPWYVMPDFASNGVSDVVSGLTNWGGTGGETDMICHGSQGAEKRCITFHHFSGFGGYRLSDDGALVAFGQGLTRDPEGEPTANAWFTHASGQALQPIEGIASFGTVLDAAFGPDGRLAMLTDTTILVYQPSSRELEFLIPPTGASAIEWLVSGQFAILSQSGELSIGRPGEAFRKIGVFPPASMIANDPRNGEMGTWVREAAQIGLIGVGAGKRFVLVDEGLFAPLTTPIAIPDPQIEYGGAGLKVTNYDNGRIEVVLNERGFARSGSEADVPTDRLTRAMAPVSP